MVSASLNGWDNFEQWSLVELDLRENISLKSVFICDIFNSSHLNNLNQGKHFHLISITISCQNYKKATSF